MFHKFLVLRNAAIFSAVSMVLTVGCSSVLGPYYTNRERERAVRYYECKFNSAAKQESDVKTHVKIVKFMIDVYFSTAFRNDSGPGHPVKLLQDATKSIILIDHIPGIEISLLVMEKDGQATFTRNLLQTNINKPDDISTQFFGKCFEMWDVAYLQPDATAFHG